MLIHTGHNIYIRPKYLFHYLYGFKNYFNDDVVSVRVLLTTDETLVVDEPCGSHLWDAKENITTVKISLAIGSKDLLAFDSEMRFFVNEDFWFKHPNFITSMLVRHVLSHEKSRELILRHSGNNTYFSFKDLTMGEMIDIATLPDGSHDQALVDVWWKSWIMRALKQQQQPNNNDAKLLEDCVYFSQKYPPTNPANLLGGALIDMAWVYSSYFANLAPTLHAIFPAWRTHLADYLWSINDVIVNEKVQTLTPYSGGDKYRFRSYGHNTSIGILVSELMTFGHHLPPNVVTKFFGIGYACMFGYFPTKEYATKALIGMDGYEISEYSLEKRVEFYNEVDNKYGTDAQRDTHIASIIVSQVHFKKQSITSGNQNYHHRTIDVWTAKMYCERAGLSWDEFLVNEMDKISYSYKDMDVEHVPRVFWELDRPSKWRLLATALYDGSFDFIESLPVDSEQLLANSSLSKALNDKIRKIKNGQWNAVGPKVRVLPDYKHNLRPKAHRLPHNTSA
jgi:hypothetical protein